MDRTEGRQRAGVKRTEGRQRAGKGRPTRQEAARGEHAEVRGEIADSGASHPGGGGNTLVEGWGLGRLGKTRTAHKGGGGGGEGAGIAAAELRHASGVQT